MKLTSVRKPHKYWSIERVRLEAKKYSTRITFARESPSAYATAVQRGWLNDVCSHMTWGQKRDWTEETLVEEARKYRTKGALRTHNKAAYLAIHRRGIGGTAYAHMPEHAQRDPDAEYVLYTYECFPFAYVGITTSSAFRSASHLIGNNRYMVWMATNACMQVYGSDPRLDPYRTGRTMCRSVAERAERRLIRCYVRRGWNVLNKVHNTQYDHRSRTFSFTPPSVILDDILP